MIIPFLTAAAMSARERTLGALERSDTLRRFVSLASWTLVSFALEKGAMVVVVFLLARILGAEDYGRLTLAQGLVNTLQIFIILGAGSMLGRYIPAMREQGVRRAVQVINLCGSVLLATTAVFIVVALMGIRIIAVDILALPPLSPIPYWMLAWVVLSAVNSLLLTVMLSFEKGRALGLVALVGAVLSIAALPAAASAMGVKGAVGGLVIIEIVKAAALTTLYVRLVKGAGVPVLTRPLHADLPLLYRFGLPVFLNSALWPLTIWLTQYVIKEQAPGGLEVVGVFGFSLNILGVMLIISTLTNRAALPIMSSLSARQDFDGLRKVRDRMIVGQSIAAVFLFCFVAALSPTIMNSLGESFASQWRVLVLIAMVGVIMSVDIILGNYLIVNDRQIALFGSTAVWAITVLSLTMMLSAHDACAPAFALLVGAAVKVALNAASSRYADRHNRSVVRNAAAGTS